MTVRRFKRSEQVAEAIREELAMVFLREVEDPRLKAVTITGVSVDDDMRSAEVRVCKSMQGIYREPGKEDQAKVMQALKSAAPFIFDKLRKRLSMRYVPSIHYRYDGSLSKSAKVWKILSDLEKKHESVE